MFQIDYVIINFLYKCQYVYTNLYLFHFTFSNKFQKLECDKVSQIHIKENITLKGRIGCGVINFRDIRLPVYQNVIGLNFGVGFEGILEKSSRKVLKSCLYGEVDLHKSFEAL